MKNKKFLPVFLLLSILLIALFFRLWQLDKIPPGLYPDVAINGNDALDTLENCRGFKLFYPENNGREGLFMWLIAFCFAIFGPSVWAIKIVAAIIGILTVLGTYLLTRELLRIINHKSANSVALLTTFFLAISFWHTDFSRIGFRAIMVPFFLVFGFYCLFSGFRQKKLLCFIVSGIFFGLGFYTYISYRFVIFIIATTLICWWFAFRKQKTENRKRFLLNALYLLLIIFVVALPIGIYFLTHPADFFGRASGVSVFQQKNPLLELGKSIILHLGMFNIHGDANWRHNYASSPMLVWPVGILFLVGIILSIKELITAKKEKNTSKFTVYCFLFSWFFFMLLPSFLSSEGAPHGLRTIGVIPVVYIYVGLGGCWLYKILKGFFKTKSQIIGLYICLGILLFCIAFSEFNKYFYLWARNPNVEGAFSKNYLEIGNYLNSLPQDTKKYVIVNQDGVPVPFPNGLPMPGQTSMFLERAKYGQARSTYLLPTDLDKIKIGKNTVIVPLQYDEELFRRLLILFPGGEIIKENEVWLYKFNLSL